MFFLPWHLGFFCRYRPLPAARYREQAKGHPLLQTRLPDQDEVPLLEQLLRDPREPVHALMAAALWDAPDDQDALVRLLAIAAQHPPAVGEAAEVAVAHG